MDAPKCPDCRARGTFCDPSGSIWICTQCSPEGKRFAIDRERATKYARDYHARLEELEDFVRTRYTPVPK